MTQQNTDVTTSANTMQNISDEERLWGFIAWLIPLIGGIISLVLKPNHRYIKHWSYLSISFSIFIIMAIVIAIAIGVIPIVGGILSIIITIIFTILFIMTWVIGILRSLEKVLWKPVIVYDLAKLLGL